MNARQRRKRDRANGRAIKCFVHMAGKAIALMRANLERDRVAFLAMKVMACFGVADVPDLERK